MGPFRFIDYALSLTETSRGTGGWCCSKLGCETHTDEKANSDWKSCLSWSKFFASLSTCYIYSIVVIIHVQLLSYYPHIQISWANYLGDFSNAYHAKLFTFLWWHWSKHWWLIATILCRKNLKTITKTFNRMFLTSKIWLLQGLMLQLLQLVVQATSFLWERTILSAKSVGLFKDLKTEMVITVKKLCFLRQPNFLLSRGYLPILHGFSWIGTKIIIITLPFSIVPVVKFLYFVRSLFFSGWIYRNPLILLSICLMWSRG